MAKIVVDKNNVPRLINALGVFIKQKTKEVENIFNKHLKDDN